jgi:hypothetical protein
MDRLRLPFDRRTGEDRRKRFDPSRLLNGAVERRSGKDRRRRDERRSEWHRVSQWSSAWTELEDPPEEP